jgi:hypothetical protein
MRFRLEGVHDFTRLIPFARIIWNWRGPRKKWSRRRQPSIERKVSLLLYLSDFLSETSFASGPPRQVIMFHSRTDCLQYEAGV